MVANCDDGKLWWTGATHGKLIRKKVVDAIQHKQINYTHGYK